MKLMTQQRQLKSLIEDGRYQPQPELVAQAMLRRRGVRTLLTGSGDQPSWSNPVGSSRLAARQPDLDPLAGDDLADPGQADPALFFNGRLAAASRSAGSAASSS